jgi:uncharacterized membrane protein
MPVPLVSASRLARRRRLAPGFVVPIILLLMGFHATSDPLMLAGDKILNVADYAGYAVCHRLTEHSFVLAGRQMPLCARCTGMYLGVALMGALAFGSGRWRRTAIAPWPVLALLLVFLMAMALDGLNSYAHFFPRAPHLYEPRNWLRLVTGMGTGVGMGLIALPALAETLWYRAERGALVASLQEMGAVLVLAAVVVVLALSNREPILYVLSVVSAAGVLLILTVLNTIGLLVVMRREGCAQRGREALLPLLAGVGLALVEIAVISTVRYSLTGTLTGFPGL